MNRPDLAIGRYMRDHFGLIDRRNALAVGLTTRQIAYRLKTGQWEIAQPRVYRAAAAPRTAQQELLAACLAAGPLAAASHMSAAWMWGLSPRPPDRPVITVPYSYRPALRAVAVHRCGDLDPSRTIDHKGVPCCDPLRTLCDVAGEVPVGAISVLVDRALVRGLVTTGGLSSEIGRRAGRGKKGPAALRTVLERRGLVGGPEPSVLEAEAMRLFQRWAIPVTAREVRWGVDGQYRIDFHIASRLAVEVDGFAYHWSPEAKARDEARRNELRLGGLFLLVYTWRDIRFDGRRVGREIVGALHRRASVAGAETSA